MKLKKFLTLTRAGIIESLQFRLGTLVIVAGNRAYEKKSVKKQSTVVK